MICRIEHNNCSFLNEKMNLGIVNDNKRMENPKEGASPGYFQG